MSSLLKFQKPHPLVLGIKILYANMHYINETVESSQLKVNDCL